MGQRCADTRSVEFTDVRVPAANVVGSVGGGFALAMRAFDRTRPLIASIACGLSQRALDEATAYANQRRTFGKRIAEHQVGLRGNASTIPQGVGFKLADMAMHLEAARLLAAKSARLVDEQSPDATYFSSMAKCFAADGAFQAAASAVQIYGANGFSADYPVEKLLRDAKALAVYGGSSEIQRLIIARKLAARLERERAKL